MPAESPPASDTARWPPLLLALRRTARPDQARVAAYVNSTLHPAGGPEYRAFLAVHERWLEALGEVLSAAAADHALPFPGRPPAAEPSARPSGVNISPAVSRWQALGYLYVFEAFRLGGRVLARHARNLRIALDDAGSAGAAAREGWGALVRSLWSVPREEHAAVVQGAQDLFAAWEDWLRAPSEEAASPLSASNGAPAGA